MLAALMSVVVLLGGSPDGVATPSEDLSPDEIPTPARLRDFVSAIDSMAPVLSGRHGKYSFRTGPGFDSRVLRGFFSRDGIALTVNGGPSPGRIPAARLASELAAKKGPVFQFLLGVAYSLRFFYENRAPTIVTRDGRLLKMKIAEQFVITFVLQDELYVVSAISRDDNGDL